MSSKLKLQFGIAVIAAFALGFAVHWVVWARSYAPEISCRMRLEILSGAKDQWAIDTHQTNGVIPSWEQIRPFISPGIFETVQRGPYGGVYKIGAVGQFPTCSIGTASHSL
ncbi:MAG: hypothetical protein JWM68_2050 [Verrucomicrobiales bacterium]|nr:hypothetical protein [Verrucomicrobiales bacterium]